MRAIISIILGITFLFACAQVQPLTGGERDKVAPKPIKKRMNPQNGTTNFSANEVLIPFDEFVKLNNPKETIVMVPPHAKIEAKLEKKTLHLTWEDTLQTNTTYTIYLNETVADITENNDSLMSMVFSTGNDIDSLSYEVKVIDAFSNRPVGKCLVGLYIGETDSILPTYFVQTNTNGIAHFKNLKAGEYAVLAIQDQNKDLLYQPNERIAFKKDKITLSWNENDSLGIVYDSLPLRLFTSPKRPKLNQLTYKAPAYFAVGATVSLQNKHLFANGVNIDTLVNYITTDSIEFIYPVQDTASMELIVQSEDFTDTTSIRILPRAKQKPFSIEILNQSNTIFPSDTIQFFTTDNINRVDTSKIAILNKEDSTTVDFKLELKTHSFRLILDEERPKKIQFTFKKGAIEIASNQLNDSLSFDFTFMNPKELGIINLDVSSYQDQHIIIEVLKDSKLVKEFTVFNENKISITELIPGNYTFRVILDENKNKMWDTGYYIEGIQPETIHTFLTPTNVRANWDIDIELKRQ